MMNNIYGFPLKKKKCSGCGRDVFVNMFERDSSKKSGLKSRCKACHKEYRDKNKSAIASRNAVRYKVKRSQILHYSKVYQAQNPKARLICGAMRRSEKMGLPFSIDRNDFEIPENCPVFGFPLKSGNGVHAYNSPTIDRIVPELGYVKGNIQVISQKANSIKGSRSLDEWRMFASWVLALKAPCS